MPENAKITAYKIETFQSFATGKNGDGRHSFVLLDCLQNNRESKC